MEGGPLVLGSISVLVVAALLLAAAVAVCVRARPGGVVRGKLRRRLVVTLKSGASFDGLLFGADREAWVLRDVVALGAADRGQNAAVDGELVLFVSDIDYCQKP